MRKDKKREKPILFNTEMVKAILDGRKVTTRRIAKGIIPYDEKNVLFNIFQYGEWKGAVPIEQAVEIKAPYQPGDILYVRETWSCDIGGIYIYKAGYREPITGRTDINAVGNKIKWHPSIHMPKEAARIWLRVTNIRIEKLQEMSASEAYKEGILLSPEYDTKERAYILAFADLWDSTIKKSNLFLYGWYSNPLVWMIEFERIKK